MRKRGLIVLLALAGCSSEPPPPASRPSASPTPSPTSTPSPRPPKPGQLPTPELDGATPLTGRWTATPTAATYGEAGRIAFAIRCDRPARQILLSVGAKVGGTLRLFTDDAAARFPAQVVDGALETPVTTGQTFLDALARADAIGIAVDGGTVQRIPGDKAIGVVVRGCRPAGR
ncbi:MULTISPECIES: hypothetical protein [unclassified Sphingomonas]|uniref:hypothetical protein n=1 Tax=unclassified Sphingomonas TaxID=196159 RepID=UPI0006FA165F|nr:MULTISPECIES: hypothetical protein [unclassified Sphingomonas]KQM61920.1 hypothetical protein ASE65_06925 [Sphingomonas sp. Leaf16]KQN13193.1 hypothetical protein ASE81_07940 [Sphingomonas sp. Leaf29]KQN20078.1 hypothetical protein ASE83_07865 [Sphingomonas sp. Leaf32]